MAQREVIYDLDWATIGLYPILVGSDTRSWPWGRPDPSSPLFMGAKANKLSLIYRYVEAVSTPTGRAYPQVKHLHPEHFISMGKIWLTSPDEDDENVLDDFVIERNQKLILYIAWMEPPNRSNGYGTLDPHWKSRTYYGVSTSQFNLTSDDDGTHFLTEQNFRAEFFKPKRGTGEVPAVA